VHIASPQEQSGTYMGIITIAFDDGYKDTVCNCIPLLNEVGIHATFAVSTSHIGKTLENRAVISIDDILDLHDDGHEIASHTIEHKNLLELYQYNGEKEVIRTLKNSKETLENILGPNINSMVFPFIEVNNNKHIRELASHYYSSSRITSEKPVFNLLPVTDRFSLTGIAYTSDYSIKDMNTLVDIAAENNLWLIEVFHLIADQNTQSAHRDEPYRFYTSLDTFKEHLDHIISTGITVKNQGKVISEYD
jgi:peptidoglycan/xylan/chitin deacetylase (PgdA/CDA1 family)